MPFYPYPWNHPMKSKMIQDPSLGPLFIKCCHRSVLCILHIFLYQHSSKQPSPIYAHLFLTPPFFLLLSLVQEKTEEEPQLTHTFTSLFYILFSKSRMEEYSHAEGAVEAVGGTAPAGARIAPETAVQRRSTDDTFIQDSNSYNEKTLVGNEAGSVYSGSEGVGVDSLYFDSSRTRLASAATAKDVLSEKEKETDDDERERRDVEPQIPSIDSEDNSPIEEVRAIVPGKINIQYGCHLLHLLLNRHGNKQPTNDFHCNVRRIHSTSDG